jgi:hypothetical protein
MKLPILRLTFLALVLASALGTSSSAPVALGTEGDYSFRESPLNSLGVKSLAELRGKPIVIDFWGRN